MSLIKRITPSFATHTQENHRLLSSTSSAFHGAFSATSQSLDDAHTKDGSMRVKPPSSNLPQVVKPTARPLQPSSSPPPSLLSDLKLPSLSPLPTLTLSPTNHDNLINFLKSKLSFPFTPKSLLHFLKCKLHPNPHLTLYDFYIFSWASTIDSYRHDHSTFEWMARTLTISSRFEQLNSLLQFVASNPCPCSDGIFSCPRTEPIFQFSIEAYCKARKLEEAVIAFESMEKMIDGKPSVVSYNALIHGFVKWGEHAKALSFYDRMIRNRVKPNVITFNILISSYCRNLQFGLALELFKEMKEKGCSPDVVSFNTLIKGFFRERKFEDAIAMAYEMIELGCQLSSATCEILVDGLCREGKVAEACELLIAFSRKGVLPEEYDYFGLVEALCCSGNSHRALDVVTDLWKRGSFPSLIACTTLVEGLRKQKKREEALALMENMLKESIVPDIVTFNCLLEDLSDIGKTVEANKLRLLAQRKGLELDGLTYRILVSGFTRERKRKEGQILVDEMLDKDFIPDLATYNRLIDGLLNSKITSRKKG
ncbi:hypothetical protein BT93_L2125 [Corymbia citriodora subsp. variegata]|uniref:Pentatricopeptide repeat-containing protein n=1 Tax=Corymbia citriodora subsp. variegata TaxID=360336 RepID=A0A8T0CM42_CORYI|nr:hypothetical protein BT93_L2125 [Corymbia citriodora subsp. variegata]